MTLSKMPPGLSPLPVGDASETINVDEGVARLMGNRELYARMLRKFRRAYVHDVAPIRTALVAGDSALAHRLAVALVGASGMIGSQRLYQGACELEEAIRTDGPDQMEILAYVSLEFKNVFDSLDVLLEGSPP